MQTPTHPNSELLSRLYRDLREGNVAGITAVCDEKLTFQVPGKSPLAGKYTRETLGEFLSRLSRLSRESYSFEVHDILSSDLHSTVILTEKLLGSGGAPVEMRAVHVWRFGGGGKPLAGYLYPRDLYAFDEAWGK
jgi:ketosteroid isomerase-like protein